MSRKTRVAGLALVALPLLTSPVAAEIFHYVDGNGRKVYVDRQSQIPPQFRDQTQRLKEESETLSAAERAHREQVLQRLEAEQGVKGELAEIEAEMASLEQRATVNGNSVQVPVELRYLGKRKTVNLIVDTGASRTLLHQDAVRSLGAMQKPAGMAQVVGGARIPCRQPPVVDELVVAEEPEAGGGVADVDREQHVRRPCHRRRRPGPARRRQRRLTRRPGGRGRAR